MAEVAYVNSVQSKNNLSENYALQEQVSSLQREVSSTKLQLQAESERCENLKLQLSDVVQEKLVLQRSLVEAEYKFIETKKELDKTFKERRSLTDLKSDLEIAVAEGDRYNQSLKENLNKLENLCTTLREQRDEQITYFKQKETSLRNDYETQLSKLKEEKLALVTEIANLKSENFNVKDEVSVYQGVQLDWNQEYKQMKEENGTMHTRIKNLEKDLAMEKEKLSNLSLKNAVLNDQLLSLKVKASADRPSSSSLSKESTTMIEDLVKKFYQQRFEAAATYDHQRASELAQQLADCEVSLMEEKRARYGLEIRLHSCEAELERARSNANSLFELSVQRTRNNLSRSNDLRRSAIMSSAMAAPFAHLLNLASAGTFKLQEEMEVDRDAPEVWDGEVDSTAAETILTSMSSNS